MSCGVGRRHSSELVLLWLWCRSAVTTPIGPQAWEPPYAVGVALKRQMDKKKRSMGRILLWCSRLRIWGVAAAVWVAAEAWVQSQAQKFPHRKDKKKKKKKKDKNKKKLRLRK